MSRYRHDGGVPEGDSVYKLARRLDRALTARTVVTSDFRVPSLATRDLPGRTSWGTTPTASTC